MEKNETSGRREVAPSPFCTFLRKNWRSVRVALLMPVIKIGGGRVEMGLVCEMDTHTCIHITALQEKRHPRFRFQSFHGRFSFFFKFRCYNERPNERGNQKLALTRGRKKEKWMLCHVFPVTRLVT